jgi:hypothetical protein
MVTAVAAPTSFSIKAKFPEFSGVPDPVVEFAIEEASLAVDSTWLPSNQLMAISYLAAHFLMISLSAAESANGQMVSREDIGEISISYRSPEAPQENFDTDLYSTPYGVRFADLLSKNFPAVAII